tara:strand:+ start:843 stop:1028 length:186 start_codon:yes stop_codon:yes gene_type:complete
MTTKNDITGDSLKSKASNKAYDKGWDRIFGKKKKPLDTKYAHPVYTRYPHLKDKEIKDEQQ